MRWNTALVLVVLLIGLSVMEAKADVKGVGVSIGGITGHKGSITPTGSTKIPAGYTIKSVELFAKPSKNAAGQGGSKIADVKADGTFSGTMKVPPGKYDVYAIIIVKDACGNEQPPRAIAPR